MAHSICNTGSSGLLGTALAAFLSAGGHKVLHLTRKARSGEPAQIVWDPLHGRVPCAALDGVDAVVHLAGENIAAGRWSAERKQKILDTRAIVTRLLCENLVRLPRPPRILLSASAVGFYGSRGNAVVDESSSGGEGFLADVCRQWEAATEPARNAGVRTARLRFGAILSPRGGMLARLLLPFRLGLGGRVGDGCQWMSWIAIDDAVGAVFHALMNDSLDGPINVVSPNPVTNAEFTAALAKILHRPALLHIPAFALRAALGEMADELLLSSIRATPKRLLQTGYAFRQPALDAALQHVLQ